MDVRLAPSAPFVLDSQEIEIMFLSGVDRSVEDMIVLLWNKCSQLNMLSQPPYFLRCSLSTAVGFLLSLSLPTAGGGRPGKDSLFRVSTSPSLSKNKLTCRDTQCRLFFGGTLN